MAEKSRIGCLRLKAGVTNGDYGKGWPRVARAVTPVLIDQRRRGSVKVQVSLLAFGKIKAAKW